MLTGWRKMQMLKETEWTEGKRLKWIRSNPDCVKTQQTIWKLKIFLLFIKRKIVPIMVLLLLLLLLPQTQHNLPEICGTLPRPNTALDIIICTWSKSLTVPSEPENKKTGKEKWTERGLRAPPCGALCALHLSGKSDSDGLTEGWMDAWRGRGWMDRWMDG